MPIELGASWFSSKCVEAQRLWMGCLGVKHCFGAGCESGTKSWQTENTRHCLPVASGTVGDKLHCQKGKSPDHQLRPQNNRLVVKEVRVLKQPGGLLRSSHPLKSA